MKSKFVCSALALPMALCASPAFAADEDAEDNEIVAEAARPDSHGPAGMMGDHVHRDGEFMIGLSWMHMRHSGTNVSGTDEISDAEIASAGYTVRVQDMEMDMAMLHIMYAPNDTLTFMLMPTWNRMSMTMLGIGAMPMGMDEEMDHSAHHTLMPGETMSHSVSGIGDTKLGLLASLSRDPKLSAHAGLTVSIPTGSVSRKNTNGTFVHYGMQPGSGTWDLEPSFTVHGLDDEFGWGAQLAYLVRLEEMNESGYRLGDRFTASAWVSRPLSDKVSLSARLSYEDKGKIEGHYNGPHGHASPPDRQENYGGQRLSAGLGGNLVLNDRVRLGAEISVPLLQDLNGIQSPQDVSLSVNASTMF
jgi:hypothetical protein